MRSMDSYYYNRTHWAGTHHLLYNYSTIVCSIEEAQTAIKLAPPSVLHTIYTLVCADFTYSILLRLELRLDLRCPAILQGVVLATS